MKPHDRTSPQPIWISGVNPVREALQTGQGGLRELILARSDARTQELAALARKIGIPVRQESREAISTLVGHSHHQGIALRADDYHYTELEALIERPIAAREPLVVLDSLQDPQNLGAILRSACFLGATGVVIPKDRSVRVTSTVIKVAAGATAYLPVAQVVNLSRALEQLKEAGLWVVGLDVEGSQPIHTADLTVPLALVVGNEQKGLRPLIRRSCDLLVQIPSKGQIQSLNASAAAAIALAEIQRQRA